MRQRIAFESIMLIAVVASLTFGYQKPNFAGAWTMDQARSFGLQPNEKQAIKVAHTNDQIDFEVHVTLPAGEYTVKDSYVVDGKEREFTPQGAKGPVANAKGKRTANWLSNGRGIAVNEETVTETPKGPQTTKIVRRWTISPQGELVLDNYIDTASVSFETKRIFTKQ